LEQSPTAHSFRTYIINVKKHAQDTSCLMFLPHWLTASQSMSIALVATLAMLLRLTNCRFVIIIIIIIII